jgi:hypothetical protein
VPFDTLDPISGIFIEQNVSLSQTYDVAGVHVCVYCVPILLIQKNSYNGIQKIQSLQREV